MAKHKYATLGFIYLFGLICAFFIGAVWSFCIAGVLAVVFLVILKKTDRAVLLFTGTLAVAFLVSGVYRIAIIDRCYELDGKTAVVTGRVTEKRNPDNDTVLLSISAAAEGTPVDFTLFATDIGIEVGDRVELTANFSELKNNTWFSEATYYYSKGIFIKARAVSEIQVTKGSKTLPTVLSSLSDWCKSRIDAEFSGDISGLIKAMLFGDKSGLSTSLSAYIRRSGIAHLTAVSGMHLSLFIHIFAILIRILCGGNLRRTSVFSIIFTVILMMFFGLTASVLRSGIMMIIYYAAAFFHRKSSAYSSVGVALLLILAVNPCACVDIGLWLSVLGTLGVGVVAPALLKKLKISENRFILTAMISSSCAALCTAPVGMLCFGGISTMAVFTGLLVQPFFTLILVTVPIALIIPFSFRPVLFTAGISAEVMNGIVEFIGKLPFSYYSPDGGAMAFFCVVLIVTTVLAVLISKSKEYAITSFAVIVSSCVIALSVLEIANMDNIKLKVHSDGDNALIVVESKSGSCVFALSDSEKITDMIYRCVDGNPQFICIAKNTDNNDISGFDCRIHTPQSGNMRYDIGGAYTVIANEGEIILDINGITVGLIPVKSETKCDIAVYTGYSKKFSSSGNYATILCDEKFYNCGAAVNACYNDTKIVINKDGGFALEVN